MAMPEQHISQYGRSVAKAAPPKERFSAAYRLAQRISRLLFRVVYPVRYHGVEWAQMSAPFILISNHNSMLDPFLIAWKCARYQIYFLGKKELEGNPILKWAVGQLHMISVDRHNMDMAAMRACLKALKDGHPLGVFPEGTRHKQGVMQNLESGVAFLALRANVPLLPVYISGRPRWFRAIDCYYGEPINFEKLIQDGVDKANCDKLLDLIRERYQQFAAAAEKPVGAR